MQYQVGGTGTRAITAIIGTPAAGTTKNNNNFVNFEIRR